MLLNYPFSVHQIHLFSILVILFFIKNFNVFSINYLDDASTFSQVLTLYNPYDFVVRYKGKRKYEFLSDLSKLSFLVLCTAPKKYSIAEPQGEIRAQHSVDT